MFQARKEDSFELRIAGGRGPFRGLDAPCAPGFHYRRVAARNQARIAAGRSVGCVSAGDFAGFPVVLISIKSLSELPQQTGLQELKVVN
jgi:hypothetical protein